MAHWWWIFPLKMVIFHSYVKLPEGISFIQSCEFQQFWEWGRVLRSDDWAIEETNFCLGSSLSGYVSCYHDINDQDQNFKTCGSDICGSCCLEPWPKSIRTGSLLKSKKRSDFFQPSMESLTLMKTGLFEDCRGQIFAAHFGDEAAQASFVTRRLMTSRHLVSLNMAGEITRKCSGKGGSQSRVSARSGFVPHSVIMMSRTKNKAQDSQRIKIS